MTRRTTSFPLTDEELRLPSACSAVTATTTTTSKHFTLTMCTIDLLSTHALPLHPDSHYHHPVIFIAIIPPRPIVLVTEVIAE
ncbi:hypothetical protein E2C01_018346 [Portunus trituberculatus]|uniref:Uncharacterized protein n=1 Tax=Portunus trituberculatus TaxID=210409 RepID=A0A5B7DU93_PORTR|nr:hypothetical protein [Portunus trituberculatus]